MHSHNVKTSAGSLLTGGCFHIGAYTAKPYHRADACPSRLHGECMAGRGEPTPGACSCAAPRLSHLHGECMAASPHLQFPLPSQEQKGVACEFHNVRYSPSSFSNCSWVPACTIRPCSRTITLSAMETAPKRWVIMIPVFPSSSLRKVSYMAFSLKGSIAEVASSRIRKSAFL